MTPPKGILVATVTPFTPGGDEVYLGWIPQHLNFLRQHGITGVVPLGTNGEGPSTSVNEKESIIDVVLDNSGDLSVIAGTGCSALPDTIEMSRYALERGADGVMIVPPFFFKNISPQGLWKYYDTVFKSLPPLGKVILYNIPALSGVEIGDELVDAILGKYPDQLMGIKDTSGTLDSTKHFIERYPDLAIYGGRDSLIGASLQAGVTGVISGVANALPDLIGAVYEAYLNGGDVESAQAKVTQVNQIIKKYPPRSAAKRLLHVVSGLPLTYVRPPLTEITLPQALQLEAEVVGLLSLES